MPTAHLLHGYLGAGKTTFARQLARDIPAIRFSHDEWRTRLYGDNPPVEHFAVFIGGYMNWRKRAGAGASNWASMWFLDFGFWNRQEREDTRAQISTLGAQLRLYRLSCSEDEAWQRIVSRNTDLQGSLVIDRNAFEGFKERFEPLDPDEARIEIET